MLTVATRQADFGDQRLFRIDPVDGSVVWSTPTFSSSQASSCPAADSTQVYLAEGSTLRARSLSDKAVAWSASLPDAPISPPVVSEGVVFLTAGNVLYSFDASDGASRWTTSIAGSIQGSRPPLIAQGAVVVRTNSGLVGVDPSSGTEMWSVATGSVSDAIATSDVVIFAQGSQVVAVDAVTGAVRWARATPQGTTPGMLLADGNTVYVNAPSANVLFANNQTEGLNLSNGNVLFDADHGAVTSCCDTTSNYRPYLKLGDKLLNHYRYFEAATGFAPPGYQTQKVVWDGTGSANEQESMLAVVGKTVFEWKAASGPSHLVARGDPPLNTTIDSGPSGPSGPTPTFTFSSNEADSTFQCKVDGGSFTSCSSPKTLAPLADGSHTFAVRAIDSASNPDLTPATRDFTVDSTPPETTIDSGPSGPSGPTPTFTFSSNEADSTFQCKVDGGSFTSCSSPKTLAPLADGSHTFAVRAIDSASNPDLTPATTDFTVDGPPDTMIDSGPSGFINNANPSFSFSSSELNSSFECRLDDSGWQDCTSPKSYSNLSEGLHTFSVKATDTGSKPDPTPAARSFTVDSQPPDAPQITASLPGSPTNDSEPEVKGSGAEAGSTVRIYGDAHCTGNILGSGSAASFNGDTGVTVSVNFNQTTHLRATATDAAGNVSACSDGFDYIAAPLGVSINEASQFTNDPNVDISVVWPAFATEALISNDGGFGAARTVPFKATVQWRLDSSGPERLPKTIYVRYIGGLSGPETYQDDIILDETAPTIKGVSIEGGGGKQRVLWSPRRSQALKLIIKANDKTSGIGAMQIASDKGQPGDWEKFKKKTTFKTSKAKAFVRVRDGAGNASGWKRAK